MVSLEAVLKSMDTVDWSNVPDLKPSDNHHKFSKDKFQDYFERLRVGGVTDFGLVLDLGCGALSVSVVHPNTIGLDYSWEGIKYLRQNRVKAIYGDLRQLQLGWDEDRLNLDDNCLDTVLSFSPPVNEVLEDLPNPSNWEK